MSRRLTNVLGMIFRAEDTPWHVLFDSSMVASAVEETSF
jgi:hypothetical protein